MVRKAAYLLDGWRQSAGGLTLPGAECFGLMGAKEFLLNLSLFYLEQHLLAMLHEPGGGEGHYHSEP